MKKLFIILALAALLPWSAVAQDARMRTSETIIADLPDPEPQNTDFIQCVKNRELFALNEMNGHRSANIVNMGLCALRLNRTLHFDPVAQQFINDEAANRLIDQPMRGIWKL